MDLFDVLERLKKNSPLLVSLVVLALMRWEPHRLLAQAMHHVRDTPEWYVFENMLRTMPPK